MHPNILPTVAQKSFVILFVLLAFCSCSKNDFKVWRDLNTSTIERIKADSADYYEVSPSGVLYRVIYPVYHTGSKPKPASSVRVSYTGWLIDGTKFESQDTTILYVGNLVQGWQEALCMMQDGERWRIYIPYNLGYGSEGQTGADGNFIIPPYSTLIFDIEIAGGGVFN